MRFRLLAGGQDEQQRAQDSEGNRTCCRFNASHENQRPLCLRREGIDTTKQHSPARLRPSDAAPAVQRRPAPAVYQLKPIDSLNMRVGRAMLSRRSPSFSFGSAWVPR
ncbi:hypothetical protein [Lysobacter gummosus]|uniref:hypothetical protein n=1 Tax=Lysobacter gummosus TaxID=262324 RepID=UPI0036333F90